MGHVVSGFAKLVVLFFKALWFAGAYWILIPLAPIWFYRKFIGPVCPIWLDESTGVIFLGVLFVAIPLTLLRNIIRVFSGNPSFSLIKTITGLFKGHDKKGIIAELNLDAPGDLSGVVFGKKSGKYVTKEEKTEGHMLVIGGQGSGKSAGIAIPTLMSWKDRAFVIDVKGELYQKTRDARNPKKIKVFNPSDPTANGYDPLHVMKNSEDLSAAAKEIAIAIIPMPPDVKETFWILAAQNVLAGGILYYSSTGMNFSEIMSLMKLQPIKDTMLEILAGDHTIAKMFVSNYIDLKDDTLGTISSEIGNHIMSFAVNEPLQKALNGHGDCITPEDLENGYDIYICIEEDKLEQWNGLLTMMVNQFLKSFERRPEGVGQRILFLLDEFGRLGKIQAITNGLSTLRSKRIQIALFIQSKAQLDVNYGRDVARVIADNCNYKAILKATEAETQEWCSKLVGTCERKKIGTSASQDFIGLGKGTGTNISTEEKRIIRPEEFGFMKDMVIIFPTGYDRIEKIQWFNEKIFKDKYKERV